MEQFDKKYLKQMFNKSDFVDLETVTKSRQLFTFEALKSAEESGINEIDVLTRVLTKVTVKENKEKDIKYSVELSLHPPGSIDNLKMFDASLITYYFNSLSGKEPVVRYIAGNSSEGKFLKNKSEDEINALYDEYKSKGKELEAIRIRTTWEVAQGYERFIKVK